MAHLVYYLNLDRVYPSSELPKHMKIIAEFQKQSQVKSAFFQQVPRRPTTWRIQCQSQETFNKLEGFSLKMTFEQKEHNIPPEKPRLKKDKKEGEDTHPQLIGKTVLTEGPHEGELVLEANKDFDKYFEEYGKILQPTK